MAQYRRVLYLIICRMYREMFQLLFTCDLNFSIAVT